MNNILEELTYRLTPSLELQLTMRQLFVLLRLHEHEGTLDYSACANMVRISRPAMSHVCDALEDEGFVQTTKNVEDLRCRWLHLTEAGKAFAARICCA